LTKTLTGNLEANFRDLAQPKTDIAEAANFCESKPLQTKALPENRDANFRNLVHQKQTLPAK